MMYPQIFVFGLFLFVPLVIGIFVVYDYARRSVEEGNWWPT